jgi:hypothetical protein
MSSPIAIAVMLAIVLVGLGLLVMRRSGQRKDYHWQPDLTYRVHEANTIEENNSVLWLTEKSAEQRHEERRDYLKERAKNDRHQDLD